MKIRIPIMAAAAAASAMYTKILLMRALLQMWSVSSLISLTCGACVIPWRSIESSVKLRFVSFVRMGLIETDTCSGGAA